MKRGTKPVPAVLRQLHGNPRKDALPTDIPEGQGLLWAPPAWMDDQQRDQWDYALANAPPTLLTNTDREVLAIWVVAAVEHAKAVLEVRRIGQVIKTKDGNAIQSPFVGIMNRQALIMLRAGAEMGFSPAARMALASPGEPHAGIRSPGSSRLKQYLAQKPDRLDS